VITTFNNKEGAKTISLAEIEREFGSDFSASGVPKDKGNISSWKDKPEMLPLSLVD